MLPSLLKGMKNSPSKLPLSKIFPNLLFINLGRKILVIFVISFISFFAKATSALSNKKSELINDCNDKSDEDGCILVQIPESYKKIQSPEITSKNKRNPLPIKTQITLLRVDMIDTLAMLVGITVEIKMKWSDSRLQFANLNLNQNRNLNLNLNRHLNLNLNLHLNLNRHLNLNLNLI